MYLLLVKTFQKRFSSEVMIPCNFLSLYFLSPINLIDLIVACSPLSISKIRFTVLLSFFSTETFTSQNNGVFKNVEIVSSSFTSISLNGFFF